jgi:catechol 2,3-dioxygenase-like lactoylglutathione lyase family enzyme
MNFLQIKETCLYCRDLDKAKMFYEGVLGLSVINYQPGKHLFLRVGNSVLLIFNPDDSKLKKSLPAHFASGPQHFAFEVKPGAYMTHKKEIESKGITVIETVTWKNGQESFYFNDPEGNVLEIVPEGIWD